MKGDNTSDRPHRMSKIIEAPEQLETVSIDLLKKLASMLPDESVNTNGKKESSFDLSSWLANHGLQVQKEKSWTGGILYVFDVCPWNSDHKNRSSFAVQFKNGAICARCLHESCREQNWATLRDKFEPGGRKKTEYNGVAGENHPLHLVTVGQLINEPEEAVSWLVEGLLSIRGLSVLAGKPKAGKSTLARNLAIAVSSGKPFLGRPTTQGLVIYLAFEEIRGEVAADFKIMGATEEDSILVCVSSAPGDAVAQIRRIALERKPVLIIIDTLFRVAHVKDSSDYIQVTKGLQPILNTARETGAHVLCLHHMGKIDRPGADGILGSTAIFGSVDTAMMLRKTERYRTFEAEGRYQARMAESVLCFNDSTRTVSLGGTKQEEEETRIGEEIYLFLAAQSEAVMEAVIDEEVDGRKAAKVRALRNLVKQGRVERVGKGGKVDPFRYSVISDSCSQVPSIDREHGNNKTEPVSKETTDSCSVVPDIYEEQGNKNRTRDKKTPRPSPDYTIAESIQEIRRITSGFAESIEKFTSVNKRAV